MYSFGSRVRFSEVDENRRLTIPGLVNYFQDCSTFQSEGLGVGVDFLKEHKRGWMLSAWQIVINQRPQLNEKIETVTWPTTFRGFYGTRNFLMKDEAGEVLAYANSVWVYMDMGAGRPARPTAEEIGKYVTEPEYDMDYAPRKIEIPKESRRLQPFPVQKHQIDTYHHVNNCQYIQMALEIIEKATKIGQVRVEYKKQAVYGDIIYPKIAREKERTVVELCDADGNIYAAVETK